MADEPTIANILGTMHGGGVLRHAMWRSKHLDAPLYTLYPPEDPPHSWDELDVRYISKRRGFPLIGRRAVGDMIDRLEYAFWKPPKEFDVILSSDHKTLSTIHWPHQKRIHFAHGPGLGPFGIPPRDEFSKYNIFETVQKLNRELLRTRLEFGFKRADAIVTDSARQAELVEFYYDVSVDEVIGPPVDVDSFDNKRPPVGDFYLSMGGFHEYKNISQIVEGFSELNVPLKVAGTGTLEDELKRKAGQNIEFVGHVKEEGKRELLGSCRGFIQNSAFGTAPMEALASGAPVIGIDQQKSRESLIPPPAYPVDIVKEGRNGVLYELSDSTEPLKNAVQRAEQIDWDYESIPDSVADFDTESTKKKLNDIIERIT